MALTFTSHPVIFVCGSLKFFFFLITPSGPVIVSPSPLLGRIHEQIENIFLRFVKVHFRNLEPEACGTHDVRSGTISRALIGIS